MATEEQIQGYFNSAKELNNNGRYGYLVISTVPGNVVEAFKNCKLFDRVWTHDTKLYAGTEALYQEWLTDFLNYLKTLTMTNVVVRVDIATNSDFIIDAINAQEGKMFDRVWSGDSSPKDTGKLLIATHSVFQGWVDERDWKLNEVKNTEKITNALVNMLNTWRQNQTPDN